MCSYCCSSSLLRRHFVLFILSRHISLIFLIFLLLLQLFLLVHFPCLHFIHRSIVYLTCFFCSIFRFILFLPSLPSSTLFHLLLSSCYASFSPFIVLKCGRDWAGPGQRQVAYACECGNEPSGSVKCGEFLDQLQTRQLLRKDSAPWKVRSIVLKLLPAPSYSYSSSHLLLSPPIKSCPAPSASHQC